MASIVRHNDDAAFADCNNAITGQRRTQQHRSPRCTHGQRRTIKGGAQGRDGLGGAGAGRDEHARGSNNCD